MPDPMTPDEVADHIINNIPEGGSSLHGLSIIGLKRNIAAAIRDTIARLTPGPELADLLDEVGNLEITMPTEMARYGMVRASRILRHVMEAYAKYNTAQAAREERG